MLDLHSEGCALFCIHSIVGAGVTDFLPLARNSGRSVRMFAVQAPRERMEDGPVMTACNCS